MPRTGPLNAIRPVVSAMPTRLRPPDTLSDGARAEFLRIVTAERPDHFRALDLPLLTQYCESSALAARATLELQRDDAPARWLSVWEKANRTMVALSARLRICPQSRQPNNPKRPERVSYYETMALEEGDDDAN